ncbi:serine threonine-protein kinase psk1 [Apiospora rasikravindrae]|uniref:Serine threonine-protein kinase psk1 n=1 Tax=Apiospora rasikravindrae TaxID=990691 RepID=A0ABR1TCE3_9PEZI
MSNKMYPSAAPALTTVRGFGNTPLQSGDEDSDSCKTPPLTSRRNRPQHIGIDDVVSANCSPVLRGQNSPQSVELPSCACRWTH